MKFYKLSLELESPAIYHARRLGYYYVMANEHIPPTTLKGSIAAQLLGIKGAKALQNLSVTGAYPKGSLPSHYFLPKRSRKGKEYVEEEDSISHAKFEFDAMVKWKKDLGLSNQGSVRPSPGDIVTYERFDNLHFYEKYSRPTVINMNVAVSKKNGSSVRGMLFAYEEIVPKEPIRFWALADAQSWDELELGKGELEVVLGKRRAMGLAKVRAEREVELEVAESGNAYCLTQCLPRFNNQAFIEYAGFLGNSNQFYTSWFTNESFSAFRPSMRVMGPGSLLQVKSAQNIRALWPAGLNFAFNVSSAHELLKAVGEVS